MPRVNPTKVTPRDRVALRVISEYWVSHGSSPSYREIARGMGLAVHGPAVTHVKALLSAGQLHQDQTTGDLQPDGLQITPPSVARLLGTPTEEWVWVPAPEPGLMAWRTERNDHGIQREDLLFVGNTRAHKGDLVIIQSKEIPPRLHVVTERIAHDAPLQSDPEGLLPGIVAADTIELTTGQVVDAFPVHYLLRDVRRERRKSNGNKAKGHR